MELRFPLPRWLLFKRRFVPKMRASLRELFKCICVSFLCVKSRSLGGILHQPVPKHFVFKRVNFSLHCLLLSLLELLRKQFQFRFTLH